MIIIWAHVWCEVMDGRVTGTRRARRLSTRQCVVPNGC